MFTELLLDAKVGTYQIDRIVIDRRNYIEDRVAEAGRALGIGRRTVDEHREAQEARAAFNEAARRAVASKPNNDQFRDQLTRVEKFFREFHRARNVINGLKLTGEDVVNVLEHTNEMRREPEPT
jgi:hypothetical protein